MAVIAPLYVLLIALAELIGAIWGMLPSVICHAVLLVGLVSHYVLLDKPPAQVSGDPDAAYWSAHILLILTLVPLLRILSVTMPTQAMPQMYWHLVIGTPLLIGLAVTMQFLGLSWADVGLRLRSWPLQIAIASCGIPLGFVGYYVLRPAPLIDALNLRDTAACSVILIVFVGFTEEILFRGLFQRAANEIFGNLAIVWSDLLFASVYIGSLSPPYVLFVAIVGAFFGWCANRTGSLCGVIVAHSFLAIGMVIIWPFVVR